MIQSFDEPLVVVPQDESADDRPGLIEGVEAVQPQTLFLEGAHEAFDDTIALRLADEGWAVAHPEPGQFRAKRIGDILRAPVAPHRQTASDVLSERAEGSPHALVNRLERRPAGTQPRGLAPHAVT